MVLGDVLGDVREDRRIVDRRVRRDLAPDRSQALLGELRAARREHRGYALQADHGRGGLHLAPECTARRMDRGAEPDLYSKAATAKETDVDGKSTKAATAWSSP